MQKLKKYLTESIHYPYSAYQKAFTVVEILVIIVIISLLATITLISYIGISNKAVVVAIQTDLETSYKRLKLFQIENSGYPTSITDCPIPASGNLCVKPSGSNAIVSYVKDNTVSPQGFCINVANGVNSYKITSATTPTPVVGNCLGTTATATLDRVTTGVSTWTVPTNVTSVQLEAWGAQGNSGCDCGGTGGSGGLGGKVFGNLVVVPGQQLSISVGSTGQPSTVTRSSVLLINAEGGGAGGDGYSPTCLQWDSDYYNCEVWGNGYGDGGSAGGGTYYAPVTGGVITPGAKSGNGRVLLTWQVVNPPVF